MISNQIYRSQVEDRKGIAWEYAIDIINAIDDANFWLNVPHAADDNYIRELARLVRNRLDNDRLDYVQFSNEVI